MDQVEHLIQLPLRISWPKNKRGDLEWFSLNLNEYRNAHHRILHNAKVAFEEMATKLVQDLPVMESASLEYRLYMGSARKADVSNICAVVDKFFCDSLVKAGVLPDDNIEFITDIRFRFMGIDRDNPRVEAVIRTTQKDEPVKIIIEASEIEAVIRETIRNHIEGQIVLRENQTMDFAAQSDGSYLVNITSAAPSLKASTAIPSTPVKREPAVRATDTAPKTQSAEAPAKRVEAVLAQVNVKPKIVETPVEVTEDDIPFDVDPPAEEPVEEAKPVAAPIEKPKVEAQAPSSAARPNSLFGNLKPPIGS